MRLLISSLDDIANVVFYGQLVPQVRPEYERQQKKVARMDNLFLELLAGLEPATC